MSLNTKSVLITGGGTGVGADMALAFAEQGATVFISGRTKASLEKVAAQHSAVSTVIADVTSEKSVQAMFDQIGPMDIVIANAGAAESAPIVKTDLDSWNRMISVNLTGVFLTLKEGLIRMKGKDWGRLISVASTAGLKGYAYVAPYSAAKHGVIGLTKSMALEVAKKGITVNALCPGFLNTEMTDRSVATIIEKTGMSEDEARANLSKNNPQGRLIEPAEVSAAALWLCGDGSDGISGQAISISGGEI
ncbi:SDR family NAD(P)-dependent oxidoreductase [Maritalea porphyrae]|uniref:SDR family NAD(P)-dependent oxidoreductase n=1 Tax=Maritalea porphyrae TaxID=880732 RepID=UPI0022AFE6EE|nr:SDR family NAD(P)-dependent oxidoreductase [Maritalea porphyrae]MCZ4273252.1 SDR family NAD(P)-dependent oxidoreductase [Maritalea porphyrae]